VKMFWNQPNLVACLHSTVVYYALLSTYLILFSMSIPKSNASFHTLSQKDRFAFEAIACVQR
jgi:hypothetical protein